MTWLGDIIKNLPQLQQFLAFLAKNPLAMVGLVILITGAILYRYVQNQGTKKTKRDQATPESTPSQTPPQTVPDAQASTSVPTPQPTAPVPSTPTTPSYSANPPTSQPPVTSEVGTVNNTVTIGGRNNKVGNITQGGKINGK